MLAYKYNYVSGYYVVNGIVGHGVIIKFIPSSYRKRWRNDKGTTGSIHVMKLVGMSSKFNIKHTCGSAYTGWQWLVSTPTLTIWP